MGIIIEGGTFFCVTLGITIAKTGEPHEDTPWP